MTLEDAATRMQITRQSVFDLERAEAEDRITIQRLRSAAEAMGCEVIVLVRPTTSLNDMIERQARRVAEGIVQRAGHSMTLEEQGLTSDARAALVISTAEELIRNEDRRLWK